MTVDFDRKITSWNKASEKLYGYPAAEVIGKSLSLVTLPDDIKKVLADIDKIKRSQKVEIFDSIRLNKDGREMNLELVLSPVKNGEGEVIGVATLARDVTDSRMAQNAKYHLAAIVESSQDSIVTINLDGVITSWNKAAEQLYGYPAAEAVGKSLTELTLPQNLLEVLANIEHVRNSQKVEIFDSVRLHKDSREIHLEVVMSPVKDETGEVIGVSTLARDVTERRRAVESLRESEARLQKAISIETVGIIFFNAEGVIHHTNEAFLRMSGYSQEEIRLGKIHWEDLTPPEFMEAFLKAADELKTKGQSTPYEKQYIRPDGSRWWGLFYGKQLSENEFVKFVINITERKDAEAQLRESEQRIRIAVEAAELGTWDWDLKTNEVFWNDRHFTLFGLKPGRNPIPPDYFFNYVHPQDRERVERTIQKAVLEKNVYDTEFRIVKQDGSEGWMSGYGRVTEEADGATTKMSGVIFDINERKQAEESLRKSEEHLNLILESTKDYAIITYNLEGRVTRWNTGAEMIFGFSEKEAVGQRSHFIFTPEDIAAKEPEKEMADALNKGRAEDERWHIRKDGSRFFASGVMQPLRDGSMQGFVKICRDQTERLVAENAVREKEMLTQLVSMQEDERRRIAREIHDHIGQQITVLRFKLESIKKMCDDAPICNEIDVVEEITERLDKEIDFLAWELRPASLDDLGLKVTLGNFINEWSRHTNIKAEYHAVGFSKAHLDFEIQTNLYRIAQEALNNIYKHAKPKNVSILLEKRGNIVSLIIEDDGVGFSTKDKKNRTKGMGLIGMSERAKICGGTLEIESKKGKGTTIFARVPLVIRQENE
jgi:PAS domain S-box-containing protein